MTDRDTPDTGTGDAPRRRIGMFMLPALAFALIVGVLGWGLRNSTDDLPSTLIGKPVPEFTLPPVQGRTLGLSSADLRGEVSLVNFFASWCVSCRLEHPVFMEMKARNFVPIYGINYKDRPSDAAEWLGKFGDPYSRAGADRNGRVAIDWGVYGIPETFVIGTDGRVVYKHIGPITPEVFEQTIRPLVERLQADARDARKGGAQ